MSVDKKTLFKLQRIEALYINKSRENEPSPVDTRMTYQPPANQPRAIEAQVHILHGRVNEQLQIETASADGEIRWNKGKALLENDETEMAICQDPSQNVKVIVVKFVQRRNKKCLNEGRDK